MGESPQATQVDPAPMVASWSSRRRFHFVQDVATPHNNALLKEIAGIPNIDLRIEYAHRDVTDYPLAAELVDEILPAHIYGSSFPNPALLLRAILFPRDKWLLVAWSNPTTRALIIWFWLTRRRFNCWIDVPPATTPRRLRLRRMILRLLRSSRVQMFAVGSVGVTYLLEAGFAPERVHNLPIAMATTSSAGAGEWRSKLDLARNEVLLVTGSRLTWEKGFDVLLNAISRLEPQVRERLRTVVVGRGPLGEDLRTLATHFGMSNRDVRFIDWLAIDEFASLIGDADLVVHPARMDSYGATSLLARAMSKPLIASRGAGAAMDIVQPGINGWLYDAEDSTALAAILGEVVIDDRVRSDAAREMSAVSKEGSPRLVAERLLQHAW